MSTDRYDWAAMRADIESGRVRSFAELSTKYGATEQAIRNRRKLDAKAGKPWPKPQWRGAASNVINLADHRSHTNKSGRGAGQSTQSGPATPPDKPDDANVPLEDEPDSPDVEAFLTLQPAIAVLMAKAAQATLRRLIRGQIEPGMHQSKADVFNATMSGVRTALAMGREIAGKGKGEASSDPGDEIADNELIIRTVRLEGGRHAALEQKKQEAS